MLSGTVPSFMPEDMVESYASELGWTGLAWSELKGFPRCKVGDGVDGDGEGCGDGQCNGGRFWWWCVNGLGFGGWWR